MQNQFNNDLIHQYYAIGDSITEENTFHYHEGMTDAEEGEEETKETIEEVFRSWHGENKVKQASILNMSLNMAVLVKRGEDATAGNEDAEIEEIGSWSIRRQ